VGAGRTVLGALAAGVGVLSKMASGSVDLVLVVVNPTVKSIEVARRAIETAVARNSRVLVIANRVQDDRDLDEITSALGEQELVVIPEDPVIRRADVEGRAPIDVDGRAPGVQALVALGERLAAAA
jgi:CO dehydrogenase maturation factor